MRAWLLVAYLAISIFLALPAHWAAYHRMFAEERPHLSWWQARVRSTLLQGLSFLWPVLFAIVVAQWVFKHLLRKGAA